MQKMKWTFFYYYYLNEWNEMDFVNFLNFLLKCWLIYNLYPLLASKQKKVPGHPKLKQKWWLCPPSKIFGGTFNCKKITMQVCQILGGKWNKWIPKHNSTMNCPEIQKKKKKKEKVTSDGDIPYPPPYYSLPWEAPGPKVNSRGGWTVGGVIFPLMQYQEISRPFGPGQKWTVEGGEQ